MVQPQRDHHDEESTATATESTDTTRKAAAQRGKHSHIHRCNDTIRKHSHIHRNTGVKPNANSVALHSATRERKREEEGEVCPMSPFCDCGEERDMETGRKRAGEDKRHLEKTREGPLNIHY